MPSCYLFKLDNIFVATILKSSDLKDFGNDSALHPIIKSLNILEKEGITVTYKGETKIVYFTLGLILGDNLGLNSILGFTKSFSSSSFFAEFAKDRIWKPNRMLLSIVII